VLRDAGDAAFVLEFGAAIDPTLLARVGALDRHVRALQAQGRLDGLRETVPTFRSLALLFDPLVTSPRTLLESIAGSASADAAAAEPERDEDSRAWSLPVLYGGKHGPDLGELALEAGLSEADVVARHRDTPLAAYMLGFLPGFAFLGDIDPALRLPRRTVPRTRVPAGSVAVANALSAVYPWESPGGWHLIGHCPVPLFDATRSVPALLAASDRVSFRSVDADEHTRLAAEAAAGALDPGRFRLR